MKAPEPGEWQRTSPLAVLFFFGKAIRAITQNAVQSLAPLAGIAVFSEYSIVEVATVGGAFAVVAFAIVAVLRYWFFRFRYDNDSILIRQGVFRKSQTDIKFDRIQGINTHQNIVFRFFGLVTVSFDTAGSSSDEGSLPAVPVEFAQSLRRQLNRRMTQSRPPAESANDERDTDTDIKPLLQLGWRDMFRIGLADRRVYVVLAALGPLYERIGENLYSIVGSHLEEFADQAGTVGGITVIIGLVFGAIVVLTAISITIAFLRFHDFRLYLHDRTLRSVGGLLTRHEFSMELGKIQTLQLQQGIILRAFGRYEMTARQARASRRRDSSTSFTIPLVEAAAADDFRRRFLGDEGQGLAQVPTSDRFRRISPWVMRTPALINVLVPLLFAVTSWMLNSNPAVFLVCLWSPIALMAIHLNWRHAGYHHDSHGLVRRSGMIGYRTVALLFRKVQRVTVTQSLLQRRKGLATLRMDMASGSVRVPFIDYDEARQLRDYILFKVESSRRAWH